MFNFEKMMDGMNLDKMIPRQREVIGYKVISNSNINDLNKESNILISEGYEPIGIINVIENRGVTYNYFYTKEFIKYKADETKE